MTPIDDAAALGPLSAGRAYGLPVMTGAERNGRPALRAAQSGSIEGFDELFRANWPNAYRAAYLIVHDAAAAEDIAQESFLVAIRALDRFDRRRPFGPWFHRIVVNRAIDWSRARAGRREVDIVPTDQEVGARPLGSSGAYSDEHMHALAALGPEQRAVIVLRYLFEYTPGEIAALLDLPRGTINSRLRRGLDQLRTGLEEES